MEQLRRISASADAAFYAIEGEHEAARIRRYVVSTPGSRAVCNRPELLGCEYTDALAGAVTAALRVAPFRRLIVDHPPARVCVLSFLRGGLNYNLRGALHEAYGLNTHSSAFMSSQRYNLDGRWSVREDMYRKLRIPRDAVILTGDVVATGVTVKHGLEVLLDHVTKLGSSIKTLIFFTIGCHKLEKSLVDFDERCRQAFGDGYEGCHVVYLEGKFKLVDSKTKLRVGLPGTDLIRRDALMAPEFEASQYDALAYSLERCTIYDAGSRAFDIPRYVEDVAEYWQQVARLAADGLTLREALDERWPEAGWADERSFLESRRQRWPGVGDEELARLYARHLARWTPSFRQRAETSEALLELCRDRLATLEGLLG